MIVYWWVWHQKVNPPCPPSRCPLGAVGPAGSFLFVRAAQSFILRRRRRPARHRPGVGAGAGVSTGRSGTHSRLLLGFLLSHLEVAFTVSLSLSAEFVGSARRDAAEVRRSRQPAQLRHGDGTRRQRKLLRRAEDAAVAGRRPGRGVLSGRGAQGPHAVPGPTSFPAQRWQPGGVMTSQCYMTSQMFTVSLRETSDCQCIV